MIFRVVSILLISALLVYLYRMLKHHKITPKSVWQFCKVDFKENLIISLRNKSVSFSQKMKSAIVHLCAALFIILFITAFLPILFGYHMSGLFMLIHTSAALLASICLIAFVFLFSNSNQLSLEELRKLADDYKQKNTLDSQVMLKVLYWLIIALILPAMLSIILMLYPLFGTDGLEFLADVHRWSVLLLTICVIFVQYYRVLEKHIENTKGV